MLVFRGVILHGLLPHKEQGMFFKIIFREKGRCIREPGNVEKWTMLFTKDVK